MNIKEKKLVDGRTIIEFERSEYPLRNFVVVLPKNKDEPYYFSSYEGRADKTVDGRFDSIEGIINLILWANNRDKILYIEGLTFLNLDEYFSVIDELRNLSSEAEKRIRNYYEGE